MLRYLFPKRHQAHTIKSGPLRGSKIVTSWHDYPRAILGIVEPALLKWFDNHVRPGEVWLDVGAHHGYMSIALSRLVGERGRVYAFEPVRATGSALAQMRQLNDFAQLTIIEVALAANDNDFDVSVTNGMARRGGAMERVQGRMLDTLWPRIGTGVIHGIKIDVEGMELDVLLGMRETLKAYRPTVVVEFHAGVDRTAVLGVLASCGYGLPGESIDGSEPYADNRTYAFYAAMTHHLPDSAEYRSNTLEKLVTS